MIPKIAHFYWGEVSLPFLRYLSIFSFHKQNPDWKINLYYPKIRHSNKTWPTHEQKYETNGPDYYPLLSKLPINQIEFDFKTAGIKDEISEVHKSDFLRWLLLGTDGGLWSDLDIIYFKPLNLGLSFNTYLCINQEYGNSIGFLLSCPDNKVFCYIYNKAKDTFSPDKYQSIGAPLLNRELEVIKTLDPQLQNIPMDIVYAYNALIIPEIFREPVSHPVKFTERSIGLHWYAGHQLAGEYINKITEKNYKTFNNILCNAISWVLKEEHAYMSSN